jgi:hypothetical protein
MCHKIIFPLGRGVVNASPWRTWEVCDNGKKDRKTVPTSISQFLQRHQQRDTCACLEFPNQLACAFRAKMTHSVVVTLREWREEQRVTG